MYDPYRGCARHIPQVLCDGVLLVTAVPEQGDAEVFSVEGLPCGVVPPRHDHEPQGFDHIALRECVFQRLVLSARAFGVCASAFVRAYVVPTYEDFVQYILYVRWYHVVPCRAEDTSHGCSIFFGVQGGVQSGKVFMRVPVIPCSWYYGALVGEHVA